MDRRYSSLLAKKRRGRRNQRSSTTASSLWLCRTPHSSPMSCTLENNQITSYITEF